MKKNLKKRLEKALSTLKEPGGSTIRSIIKVINKDGPLLSLRKVLEALQEGINEGFLCMYNGRFKLKQHIQNKRFTEENTERKNKNQAKKDDEEMLNTSESENEDSEGDSEDDGELDFDATNKYTLKNTISKRIGKFKAKKTKNWRKGTKATMKNKNRVFLSNKTKKKSKAEREKMNRKRCNMDINKAECGSILEITTNMPEKKLVRPTTEKPDLKKQRGPRCTSMKKDVRMPSKVHIPFVPPSVPQGTNIFNDLMRRSPEPVNGPVFDTFMLTSDNFAFFRALN